MTQVSATGFAICSQGAIGSIVTMKGNWTDEAHPGKLGTGAQVCPDSRLVRAGPLSDGDMLSVRPVKQGVELIVYNCGEGVTCAGPLNLGRIPVSITNSRSIDDLLTFLNRHIKDRDQDLQNLHNFIHRGHVGIAGGVLLASDGRLLPKSMLRGTPAGQSVWLEFCHVRPGGLCSNPPHPFEWDGTAESVPVEPGFYKVVRDEKFGSRFERTENQSYFLIVEEKDTYDILSAKYAEAREQAALGEDEESARGQLVTYLFYLGRGYE